MAGYTSEVDDEEEHDDSEPKAKQGANAGDVKRYWSEVTRYERAAKDWHTCADKIVKRYLDEDHEDQAERRFALLWANVQTLQSSIYGKLPIILCERRYRDRDPVGRVAADMMERFANTSLDMGGVDEIFRLARDDVLLPGRGQIWVRYDANVEEQESEQIDFKTRARTVVKHDKVTGERVCVEYVYWRHWGHNVARTWQKVWLVWRILYCIKSEVSGLLGDKIASKLKYSVRSRNSDDEEDEAEANCAEIYEFWDSRKKLRTYAVKQSALNDGELDDVLESKPPPVSFGNFFPCPEPAYATKTSKSLIPTPDYEYYRDQAKDIDDLTAKISNLLDWLRVKAFIPNAPSDGGADAIQRAVTDTGNEDIFIEVGSWAEWVEKGGAKALIDWLPVDMIVKALQQALQARGQIVQDVYQITGISDIMRGQSDPEETFGAQGIKKNMGSRRIGTRRDDFALFCERACRLVVEAGAENFTPETLAQMTGYKYTPGVPTAFAGGISQPPSFPPPQLAAPPGGGPAASPGGALPPQLPNMAQGEAQIAPGMPGMPPGMPPLPPPEELPMSFGDDVIELLRDDRMRTFRVKVETDSTTNPDDDQEKQRRTEFLSVIGAYLEKAVAALQMAPDLAGAVKEILSFAARGFRVGRNLESTLENAIDRVAAVARQPKPDKIDEVSKAKMAQGAQEHAQKLEQGREQFKQETIQRDQQHQQKLNQADQQFGMQIGIEREKGAKEIAVEQERRRHDRADRIMDHGNERRAAIEDRDAGHAADAAAQDKETKKDDGDKEAGNRLATSAAQAMDAISGGLEGLAKQVAAIMDEMSSPIELIKDGNGRTIGGKRGSRTVNLQRGDAS